MAIKIRGNLDHWMSRTPGALAGDGRQTAQRHRSMHWAARVGGERQTLGGFFPGFLGGVAGLGRCR